LAPAGLKQDVNADHTGPQERLGIQDRTVYVRFGREIHDGIDVCHERFHERGIGDVTANERQPRGLLAIFTYRREVCLVTGVRQLVEDRDPGQAVALQDLAHEARADEPGAAGDQEVVVRGHPPTSTAIEQSTIPQPTLAAISPVARPAD